MEACRLCLVGTRNVDISATDLYFSQNIFQMIKPRRMKRAGHVARMGEKRDAHRVLKGEVEGKKTLGRPTHR